MKTILFLFVILFGENLVAQEWKYITKSANGTEYFYKPNTSKTAWIKQVSSQTAYYEKGQKKIVDGYNLTLWRFDCEDKKIGVVQQNTYNADGELLNTFTLKEYEIELTYVVPDTIGENLINTFCSN